MGGRSQRSGPVLVAAESPGRGGEHREHWRWPRGPAEKARSELMTGGQEGVRRARAGGKAQGAGSLPLKKGGGEKRLPRLSGRRDCV